jgi:hypothetical protein
MKFSGWKKLKTEMVYCFEDQLRLNTVNDSWPEKL